MNQQSITCGSEHGRTKGLRTLRAAVGTAVTLAVIAGLSAEFAPLTVERDGDRLRLSAPQLHFLTDEPLERLHDGRSVTYVFTVSLRVHRGGPLGPPLTRQVVFSYDLWEERFAVVRLDDPKVAASHLTPAAAEAWCVDLLTVPIRAVPAEKTFVVKLECSLREEGTEPADTPSATTFTRLIDLLSRKARATPPRWEAESVPLRLADLKDKAQK
jgi:hypothetical protein